MRTITHPTSGAVLFDLAVPAAVVVVHCEDRAAAEVTLEPVEPGDSEAARLIESTSTTSDADRFAVRVPLQHAGHPTLLGGGAVVITGTGGVTISGGAGEVTVVNGRVISGNAAVVRGGGLRITARLPKGSSVSVDGEGIDLAVRGASPRVEAHTVAGAVAVDVARTVRLLSTSADLRIGSTSDVTASSVSGDITIQRLAGRATVDTVSGDIAAHAVETSQVRAESVSGDVDITADRGIEVDAVTSTVSGRTRNRRR